jgi:hypothetical protein
VVPRHSRGVDRGAVCGLLMARLEDVSAHFAFLAILFISGCTTNLRFYARQAVSLAKVAEKFIEKDNWEECNTPAI